MSAPLIESLVRYAHFAGIMLLASMLLVENIRIKRNMAGVEVRKLAPIDGLYGLGAVIVLVAGLTLWLEVGKPADFYSLNPIFHIKLTLFFLIALISIIPTIFIIRNRRSSVEQIVVPKYVIAIKRLELLGIVLLPLLAVLIARGIGLSI